VQDSTPIKETTTHSAICMSWSTLNC